MVIEQIHIQNFKALKNVELRNLPSLAVFVGTGQGKPPCFAYSRF